MGKVLRIFGDIIKEVDEVKTREGYTVTANATPDIFPNGTGTTFGEDNNSRHYEMHYKNGELTGISKCNRLDEERIRGYEINERLKRGELITETGSKDLRGFITETASRKIGPYKKDDE